ncbi:MAG: hypothetical protein ACOWWR_06175 [Eubacteriales bacterium]
MSQIYFYRYQITPNLAKFNGVLDFDGLGISTTKQLANTKNRIFESVIEKLQNHRTPKEIYKGRKLRDDIFELKIARSKKIAFEKNFEDQSIIAEPSIDVYICNDQDIQVIGLVWGSKAFQTKEAAISWLTVLFNRYLKYYALDLSIQPIYRSHDFWKFVRENENEIRSLEFTISYPNLPSLRKELGEALTEITKSTNSENSRLTLNAGKKKNLIIDEDDKRLNNLVNYSSSGGGKISVRTEGQRGYSNLEAVPISRSTENFPLENYSKDTFQSVINASKMATDEQG